MNTSPFLLIRQGLSFKFSSGTSTDSHYQHQKQQLEMQQKSTVLLVVEINQDR